ncbi:hypothetical protein CHELA17_63621 [Chelatococcus asaccharovorans]|nr:hypothetical protein CHELA17_63621 [Chelatococcus asaccharovorans]
MAQANAILKATLTAAMKAIHAAPPNPPIRVCN